jgi:hypothetical protein
MEVVEAKIATKRAIAKIDREVPPLPQEHLKP